MKRTILGPRIRERRRELGITQAGLARSIDISASYLNLIEHNKRDIGGKLLGKIAGVLDVPLDQLDGAADRRLLQTLDEVAQNPELRALGVEIDTVGELIGRFPGWARGIVALSRSERQANNVARMLGDRLTHDPFLAETIHKILTRIASLRSAAEIIEQNPDINVERRDRFYAIIHDESRHLSELGDALASFFDNSALERRKLTPADEVDEWFDQRENHFAEIESRAHRLHARLPVGSAATRLHAASELVEEKLGTLLDRLVGEQAFFETEAARHRGRKILAGYAVTAIMLPMEEFRLQAESLRYDIDRLADHFAVADQLVYERLSALPTSERTPRFGYYQSNASGTILRSRNLPRMSVPRYGTTCPLWILYRAQQNPGLTLRQRVQFPSGDIYVFVARAHSTGDPGFGQPRHYLTDMITIADKDAMHTAYAPERETPMESVGYSCSSCPRRNCRHRVADPLTG